jgi:hypothetical protein
MKSIDREVSPTRERPARFYVPACAQEFASVAKRPLFDGNHRHRSAIARPMKT